MEVYHRIGLLCLAGMLVSLVLSAVLYVRLEIRDVLGYLTGSRAAREIQRLEQKTNDGPENRSSREAAVRERGEDETHVLER